MTYNKKRKGLVWQSFCRTFYRPLFLCCGLWVKCFLGKVWGFWLQFLKYPLGKKNPVGYPVLIMQSWTSQEGFPAAPVRGKFVFPNP